MKLIIHTDGGSRGNPGPAAAGIVISDDKGHELFAGGFFLGKTTNNVAEYEGIARSLEIAAELGGTDIQLFSDSELLVKQITGVYRVKNEQLKTYYDRIQKSKGKFKSFKIKHVYRADNKDADAMVNQSLDASSDVGGFSNSTGGVESATDECGSGDVLPVIDLRKKVQFASSANLVDVQDGPDLSCSMLCLKANQSKRFKVDGKCGTFIVMRGNGTVEQGGAKSAISPGAWLEFAGDDAIQFSATDEMVVVLTTIK